MKSSTLLCLAVCLFAVVISQVAGQGPSSAAAGGSSGNAMQRMQLMRALSSRGGGLSGIAPYLLMSGGMDNQMIEMMMCMRSPIFCMTMMQ